MPNVEWDNKGRAQNQAKKRQKKGGPEKNGPRAARGGLLDQTCEKS